MDLTFKLLPFAFLFGIKFGILLALPVITPNESEYIIRAKDDFKLICKGDVNVTWLYPDVLHQLKQGVPNIDVTFSREGDIYVTELSITNASGLNFGFYFCKETKNPQNGASVYLYIDDDEILSVRHLEIFVLGTKFQSLFIPCKPTHPSVEVKLYSEPHIDLDKKGTLINTGTEDSEWSYNPTMGFYLSNLTQFSSTSYICTFRKSGAKDYELQAYIISGNIDIINRKELTTSCHQRCEQIVWPLRVQSHYQPINNKWFDSHGKRIENDEKFTFLNERWGSVLTLNNVTIKDRGNYSLVVTNGLESTRKIIFLNVTAKPNVEIMKDQFHMVGATETVKCIVWAFPPPEIKWEFKGCIDGSCEYKSLISSDTIEHDIYTSTAAVRANQSGYVKCVASNIYGSDERISDYIVTDVKEGFNVLIKEDGIEFRAKNIQKFQLAAGSQVQFECLATIQNYSSHIEWYFDDTPIPEEFNVQTTKTAFSVKHFFIIPKMGKDNAGMYICETKTVPEDKGHYHAVTVEVVAPQKPRITVTNMDQAHEKVYPSTDNFTCLYEGIPRASIKWYKDGSEFVPDNTRAKFENMKQVVLFIKPHYTTHEGEYTCRVTNRLGSTSKTATLKFANKPTDNNTPIYVPLGIFLVMLIAIVTYLTFKIRKKRNLREARLANFEKGAVERINPNLGVDDQAQLLPYNKKSWEIPKERIKLGKQLGAGAFGVVMQAVIERYDNNTDLKVAVKMMKTNAGDLYFMALLSELKIMVHLGKHLNVVNLVGACTKHIAKKELYVIVEFCPFGNLRNYLLHHRENFINQVDPGTEKINYSIGADVLSRPFAVGSDNSLEGPPKGIEEDTTNSNYVAETTTPMSLGRNQDNKPSISNRIPLKERSNCKGDYKRNIKPICTKDLLIWAFQVSRGMEYLASRRVLHGDLASRNILLADENIVKICDFGLAKRMYKSDDYKKKGRGPLPFKWMSIESMRDKVFSTQSDVWSFGIVLWEFFSLARTPYPGMEAGENILQKLVEGYRMEQPTYATKEIYSLMLNCWEAEPLTRPTFQSLSDRIGSMLGEPVTKFYIDLNDPYLVMNKERIQGGQNDYLQMVSPPDFETLSSPNRPRPTLNTTRYDYIPKPSRPLFGSSKP